MLELYLTQIPAAVRQTLKRADDPTGTTAPATFVLRSADDVARLLPATLPRFRPGDALPGKADWVLERQLGVGGFGEVWLARHPKFQSLFGAVKFCRSLQNRDRDMLHEGELLDRLLAQGSHPNVVKLLDVHLDGDAPWLMFEYVDGGDLADLVHQWASLPTTERQQKAISALRELARAIGHFHALDPAIVHRDLKPANILRDKLGRLRITDFGIGGVAARRMLENETRATSRSGRLHSGLYGSYTPLYASPQQRDGADPDPRDDVHALGVIGYQMLTGQLSQGVGSDLAEDLKEMGVQPDLIELLRRCTAQKLERRPKNAAEVADLLSKLPTPGHRAAPIPVAIPARPIALPAPQLPPSPLRGRGVGGEGAAPPDDDEDKPRRRRSNWRGALEEILADEIERVAFINQARSFLGTLTRTETNIAKTHALSIIFPMVFGLASVAAITMPTVATGVLPFYVAIPIGLLVGAIISGIMILILMLIRNTQKEQQDAAVERFAVTYPAIVEGCGGTSGLRDKEFIRSILLSVDELPKPGFFERIFAG